MRFKLNQHGMFPRAKSFQDHIGGNRNPPVFFILSLLWFRPPTRRWHFEALIGFDRLWGISFAIPFLFLGEKIPWKGLMGFLPQLISLWPEPRHTTGTLVAVPQTPGGLDLSPVGRPYHICVWAYECFVGACIYVYVHACIWKDMPHIHMGMYVCMQVYMYYSIFHVSWISHPYLMVSCS